ncbi:hypothetical protein [Flavobacterium ginsenosidimutans]|uniref:hypothetical protein n=1 Tax=Flavobacterium ginsenosidimutans TaxID=687844 RepID=UPI000DAEB317|nr:hypothetical protein [Flavobacterium ginsenosidimutans]KAF2328111.1 hypothetical protein DM444_20175 [Flavobacterium ginsenosidimutans]
MKTVVLCLTITFFTASCSNDEILNQSDKGRFEQISYDVPQEAQNLRNPFEETGIIFYNALTDYASQNGAADSKEKQSDQLLFIWENRNGKNREAKSLITLTPEMIAAILADPYSKLLELIDSSALSSPVKLKLNYYVDELVSRQNQDYEDVHDFIVSYEDEVMEDSAIDEDEKETILKVSAISRYSLYEEARNRDRDWETAVTNKPIQNALHGVEPTLAVLAAFFNTLH